MLRESYFLHTSSKSNWLVAKCRNVKGRSRISNLCDRKRSWDKIFQYFLELFLSEAKHLCYLQPSAISYLRCAHCANGLLKQAQDNFALQRLFFSPFRRRIEGQASVVFAGNKQVFFGWISYRYWTSMSSLSRAVKQPGKRCWLR